MSEPRKRRKRRSKSRRAFRRRYQRLVADMVAHVLAPRHDWLWDGQFTVASPRYHAQIVNILI